MRKRIGWLFLAGALLGAPAAVQAQTQFGGEVPPVHFTGPLSHPRFEDGGLYCFLQGLYWRETRPLRNQLIAVRGFFDVDGSVTGGDPGNFIGSGRPALSTNELRGPGSYQPGFNLGLGWRFESGVVLQLNWYHLVDAHYAATAGLLPANFHTGANLADSFLSSPVFNFPADYAGNDQNLTSGNSGGTFGIWNAASNMSIEFIQRFDMFDITGRFPIWQTDCYRSYGLLGPRIVVMWERFKWRTVDLDLNGQATADTSAIYSNVTSNRLYGVHIGCGNEWWLGDTPIGGFSCTLDLEASIYGDFVKGRARYELGDFSTAATRARNMASIVPGVEGRFSFWWYPWEAIQVQVGYNAMMFFNTVASPRPVDFDFGSLDPRWEHGVFRFFHGFTFGAGVVF
jgi:hypothetical protein